MKHKSKIVGLALLAIAGGAQAEGFIGVKGGLMMIDLDNFDDPFNIGLYGGIVDDRTGFGGEVELTTTAVDGEFNAGFSSYDVSMTTLAGYGTYRSSGATYFKGRLGVAYEDVEIGSASDDDTDASGGIGIGFEMGGGRRFEIEYTIIEEDVDFLSVGMTF